MEDSKKIDKSKIADEILYNGLSISEAKTIYNIDEYTLNIIKLYVAKELYGIGLFELADRLYKNVVKSLFKSTKVKKLIEDISKHKKLYKKKNNSNGRTLKLNLK